MIRAGRVTVDGAPAHLGQKVDPASAQVAVDRVPLPLRPDLEYYLLYKPSGVVSTASDPHGRKTVVEMVPSEARVYPVGRLDRDSEGLLLLTNDGELANVVTHPRYGVTKTYVAVVAGHPGKAAIRRLVDGIELDDGPAQALAARATGTSGNRTTLELVMGEGRKREVRRMCDAIGHPVQHLVRTAIGPLRDRSLKPGTWRRLTIDEVRALYGAARTPWQDSEDD